MNKYNQSTRLTHTSSISHATIQDENGSKTLITSNKNRRQSIIPSSHLPRTNDLSPPMEEENEDSSSDDLFSLFSDHLQSFHTSTRFIGNKWHHVIHSSVLGLISNTHFSSSHYLSNSDWVMQSPNNSRDRSQPISSHASSSSTTHHRDSYPRPSSSHPHSSSTVHSSRLPRSNPHRHLLQRNTATCPSDLTGSKRTRWFKTANKAERNANLVRQLPSFQYPDLNYDTPLFIHHLTPCEVLQSLIQQLREVSVYVIDTESNPPTKFNPEPVPSLLQIQAIHHQHSSTILLIETQHLPYPSSPTFVLIQQLCQLIFSPNTHIAAWGDPLHELIPYRQFGLFDLSNVRHFFNLQSYFTERWNNSHPHCATCPLRSQLVDDTSAVNVDLVCYVDSSDIDDFLFPQPHTNRSLSCKCPDDIRPYKKDIEQWSLQNAISYTFHEAIDKHHTFNIWSCGLDPLLTEGQSSESINTRADMTLYAINDVLAPTRLLFHLDHVLIHPHRSLLPTLAPTILTAELQPTTSSDPAPSSIPLPSYFILSDSHAKYLEQTSLMDNYMLQIHAVSGLKWRDDNNHNLCVYSLLRSNTLSSSFNAASAVMLLVGTNSVRYTDVAQVIQQVAYIIDYLHRHYPHLNQKHTVSIVSAFPCLNTTRSFPSTSSLSSNISLYNEELHKLSTSLNFTVINFPIDETHLANDQIHLHFTHRHLILQSITNHFDCLFEHSSSRSSRKKSSATYKKRRNQIRHQKMKVKRHQLTIKRSIDVLWKPKHVKHIIKFYNIKYARILEVHKHIVTIQFNQAADRDIAEALLPDTIFDVDHFHQHFPQEH